MTPSPPLRHLIDAYGDMGFRLAGQRHEGSLLLVREERLAWLARDLGDVTIESLAPILAAGDEIELLLLGTGGRVRPPPGALVAALRERGLAVETMDTGAACRTYNVLVMEGRRVAAALLAVP